MEQSEKTYRSFDKFFNLSKKFGFQGTLKKIRILSNDICYGLNPNPEDEVEQRLTINSKGRVWFSGYKFGEHGEINEKVRSENFVIKQEKVNRLFTAFSDYFSNNSFETFATDSGYWVMELTNTEGEIYKQYGSLGTSFLYKGVELSGLVRNILEINNLYVFYGTLNYDFIEKIVLEYRRIIKKQTTEVADDMADVYDISNYEEQLTIDRKTGILEHIQNIYDGGKISHKYELEDEVEVLFDRVYSNSPFLKIKNTPDDVIDDPNETQDYKITVYYKEDPPYTIEGSYDKYGLPQDFKDFIKGVFHFLSFYGWGEIFDSDKYNRVKRRKSDYIYCSVVFDNIYKSYYYITDDDTIEVGDYVIVPAGKDNIEKIVEVVDIEYFSEENVPFDIDKVKRVIGKCDEESYE